MVMGNDCKVHRIWPSCTDTMEIEIMAHDIALPLECRHSYLIVLRRDRASHTRKPRSMRACLAQYLPTAKSSLNLAGKAQ